MLSSSEWLDWFWGTVFSAGAQGWECALATHSSHPKEASVGSG